MTEVDDPGEICFVLHTHLPWLKNHGVWPVGEEWLFQAWAESWYPVTEILLRLADEGHRDVLTLGVTPLVAWQVADRRLRDDLGTWLGINMWRAEEQRSLGFYSDPATQALGPFYWRRYADLSAFHEQVEAAGGLLAVWADLAARGVIEILGGPATHPYLPLQADADLIDAQLACGLAHHRSWAGTDQTGLWVPEMGYRPRGAPADPTAKPGRVDRFGTPTLPRLPTELPGLEEQYAAHGVTHFLVDAATLVRAAGGPERDWTVRPAVNAPSDDDPYEIVHDGVLVGDSDVVAFARDLSVAYRVWSPTAGYPGNAWYRDFFARGSFGLHPSWRVTDKRLGPMDKASYRPDRAMAQVHADVGDFHRLLRRVLDPRPDALVVAAYDTELFGHWWFEGPVWLERMLRTIAEDPSLRTTTLRSRLQRRPPTRRLDLPESSWGYAKGHATWVTEQTRPLWRSLRAAEQRAKPLLVGTVDDDAATRSAREQLARELAQLQCSDWPFMMTRGNSPDYAQDRFAGHRANVDVLCRMLEQGQVVDDQVAAMAARNGVPTDPKAFLSFSGTSGSRH